MECLIQRLPKPEVVGHDSQDGRPKQEFVFWGQSFVYFASVDSLTHRFAQQQVSRFLPRHFGIFVVRFAIIYSRC